ncbi:hypothetical protein NDU88_002409 [Pleurodeles waltl]|uniref:Uncharacterized protein n=1 Tax=Pleurodeles waltl TaxID=8319 RepID=A0AAV7TKL2_PLEWA|nr:hypothetical protein NDU88_002409 [Pleurodeles waltl]
MPGDPVPGCLPPTRAEDKAQARGSHPGSCHSPSLGPTAQPVPLNPNQQGKPAPLPSVRQGPPGYDRLEEGCTHPRPCRGLGSLGSLSPRWASGMGAQTNLRPRALRPLYTLGIPYQGLRDPVPGYLPPGRAEDKAQARGSHPGSCYSPGLGPRARPGPLNPNQQGKPAPWPSVR